MEKGFHYKPGVIYHLHIKRKFLKDSLDGGGLMFMNYLKFIPLSVNDRVKVTMTT